MSGQTHGARSAPHCPSPPPNITPRHGKPQPSTRHHRRLHSASSPSPRTPSSLVAQARQLLGFAGNLNPSPPPPPPHHIRIHPHLQTLTHATIGGSPDTHWLAMCLIDRHTSLSLSTPLYTLHPHGPPHPSLP
eukprot:GHVU01212078.1.p1 GENE.GHVU01212078.1~~GHVU01212078.1.p1  ORF type:complete len:133 (-),score=2.73 GHVU01212078.1:101-499(-)